MLVLLAAFLLAVLVPLTWQLINTSRSPSPIQADSLKVVDALHSAVNSNNTEAMLALFAAGATVNDNGSVIQGTEQIRNWILYSERMTGLQLKMLKSEVDGEKIVWLDTAHNGPEIEHNTYLLRWEAIVREGKIQSITVMPRYWPDSK
jgi:hypothetical protein